MRTGPVPRVSPTAAAPFKGWLCTGVVGAAIDLSKLGSPVGPQAAKAIAAQPTKANAAGLAMRRPKLDDETKADIRTPNSPPDENFQQAGAPLIRRKQNWRPFLAVTVFAVNYGILGP
jgi:hypothetical protein